jgi:putative transposase
VVFIPKCCRRTIYGELRPHLGEVFRKLAQQKESRIEEGHLLADHVHVGFDSAEICGVASGWLHQGKSAIHLARVYGEKKRSFVGQHLFEPSTEIIRKGKASKPTEFGKMVKPQEAENQIIIDYEVYGRRPNDRTCWSPPSRHIKHCSGARIWWRRTRILLRQE